MVTEIQPVTLTCNKCSSVSEIENVVDTKREKRSSKTGNWIHFSFFIIFPSSSSSSSTFLPLLFTLLFFSFALKFSATYIETNILMINQQKILAECIKEKSYAFLELP